MSRKRSLLCYVLLSIAAAVMLLVIVLGSTPDPYTPTTMDKMIVSLAFMASCIGGIALSARPGLLRGRDRTTLGDQAHAPERPRYVAHHPDCGSFEDRVVEVRGRKYCGGCLGLMLGSAAALALTGLYLLTLDVDEEGGLLAFLSGLVVVVLCMVAIATRRGNGTSHLLANSFMVVGFFLVVMGVLSSTGSFVYGLFAVVVSFLWLDARVQISDWRHASTCATCAKGCGIY